MYKFMSVVVSLALSGVALAAEPIAKPQPKPAASTTAKPQAAKPGAPKQALAKPKPSAPKYYYVRATPLVALPVAATATVAAAAAATAVVPEAGEVHTGLMVCEMGNSVSVTPDPQQPARFIVQMKKYTFHMTPVETSTGAVRLEDAQAGAMWLQLPNKSMLMNSKLGQRMADECQSDHQTAVAHRMKLDPPPSLLDLPAMAKK
jgi:hypothetical protein